MNNKKRKLIYIQIKNSWRISGFSTDSPIIINVGSQHNYNWNPKYPLTEIHMDFKNKDDIIKYGVKAIGFR